MSGDGSGPFAAPGLGCWECSQKDGHAATGGAHPHYWCRPERCPDRMKHAERVYAGRFDRRVTSASRDGVLMSDFIDGKAAGQGHVQRRCVCGLLLIWEAK